MKYEAPELTALTSAINAIQTSSNNPPKGGSNGDGASKEGSGAYEDWE